MARPTLQDDPFPEERQFDRVRDWYTRRLEGRSRREIQLLAGRAAMRRLPFLHQFLDASRSGYDRHVAVWLLSMLRCYPVLAGAAFVPPAEITRFDIAAVKCNSSAFYVSERVVLDAPATAVRAAANAVQAHAAIVADAIANADIAALRTAENVPAPFAAAFDQDCRTYEMSGVLALVRQPLWSQLDGDALRAFDGRFGDNKYLGGMPIALRPFWGAMNTELRALDGDFAVWAEWYEGILEGEKNGRYLFGLPTGSQFDPERGPAKGTALRLNIDIALIEENLWQDSAKVNAEIRRFVEEARGEKGIVRTVEDSPPAVPSQGLGPRFQETGHQIDVVVSASPDAAPSSKRSQSLLDELREAATDLQQRLSALCERSDAHLPFFKASGRYLELLSPEQPDIDLLFARGLRLESAHAAVMRDISTRDLPPLEDDAQEALLSTIKLHGIFIATTDAGRELLDAAERYAYDRTSDQSFKNAAVSVAEKMENDRIATERAMVVLGEALEAINTGKHPHREGVVARGAVANALAYLGNAAVQGVIGSAAFELMKLGATPELMSIGARAAQFYLNHSDQLTALAKTAEDSLRWVPHLIEWLRKKTQL